jgi:hypothetical protein
VLRVDADVAADDVAQVARSEGVGSPCEHGFDVRGRGAVSDSGLVAGSCQGIEGEVSGEVCEGAGDGRDGDRTPRRCVVELPRSARPDAGHAARGACGHLWRRGRSLQQTEEMRGGAAAEQRALAAGHGGRQVAGLDARRAVADAVDAAMNRQQRAGPEPMLELGERDAGAEKLCPGHHPVLAGGQAPELPLRCAAFTRHCRV